ncbi:Uncharacterized protein OBRU01_20664 [Operophtera brumata]|uniref:Fatty acid synthase S-acetyltransferase n=1 Tax=Operophtera brumata TaxID=104452 RepID=A0A0L7KUR1_OPEBR|nr:Uncharacterized protein OBRU01_20664 [Operophtera brumata]
MDDEHKTRSIVEKAEYRDDAQRPLWFVYSGMGSQWPGMGAQLMRIPIFAAAIERCRKVLQSKGIDVVNIITSRNKATLDNILNSLVGIAAIQIGLTDILKELGLKPDKIIGHSTGELGCAYADGCLTAEEMILAAYSRGRVSLDTQLIHGAMAAVGLGYKNCSILCPPEIDVACHNGLESCTISGPADKITEFVAKLKADGVFSKEVPCSNIAYHSRYITAAGPKLLEYLTDVVRDPKPRSDRWLSTSVPEEKWNEPRAKLCSADYLTNNLLSPVLFEETSRLVPSNAVLVEIAPHGLLQAILKRSLPESCKNIALTNRGHADNAVFLLDAIGQLVFLVHRKMESAGETIFKLIYLRDPVQYIIALLYIEGFTPRVQALYPKVEFPVSTGTPHLSHHVEWMHSEHWNVIKHVNASVKKSSSCDFLINLHEDEHIYLKGNIVRGKVLYPFSAALVAVWDTLAMTLGERKKDVSVQFRDVHLYSQPIMHDQRQLKLNVSLHRGNGQHEFKSIYSVNENMNKAKLLWNENWSILIDSMVQLNVLKRSHLGIIAQPSLIRELSIDVEKHYKSYDELTDGTRVIEAKVDPLFDKTSCGGIVLRNIKFRNIVTGTPSKIALELAVASTSDNVVVVQYAGVNVADINKAAGVIPFADDENYFGMDFSGLAESGERVMGLVKNGAISTVITAQPDMMWPVPAHWSLEDAATVPLAYVQAFYCLKIKNKLGRNTKVLIHGGAGALGQAAISIALAMGCQVFTTVADQSKKLFLKKLFPQLRDEYIGNSRDCSFGDIVLNATNSEGCDIVLSCVKGDLRNNLRTLVSEGIAGGYVRPLSRVTYGPDDAPRAFRLLAASRHRGRVLLRLSDPQPQVQSRLWKNLGVKVEASFGKLFTYEEIFTLLNMANESKPVEGIYVLATDKNSNNMELTSIVNQIDAASRIVCPLLRYFTVVSIEKNIGARACLSRSFDREPAIALSLPDIKKLWFSYGNSLPTKFWATDYEEALQYKQKYLNGSGLKNIYDCKGDTTLKDLRVENEVLYIIKSYLNDTVNVTLEIEDILELTKNKINQIELNANGEDFKDVKGLKTYFSYVDSDELRGTTDLMLLDTLVNLVVRNQNSP